MKLGIDRLLQDSSLRQPLHGRRIALLGHPASMTTVRKTGKFMHSLDLLAQCSDLKLTAAFGPQHGMKGEKQDNMVESEDYLDPGYKIPIFSLYGEVRRPTPKMLDTFDVLLVDIQDVGTRVYTFLTTLLYVLEAAAQTGKSVWVLDRPNPAGRPVEGTLLDPAKWTSFVGAAEFPMRHGLTLGEAAQWFVKRKNIDVDLNVIAMKEYGIDEPSGYGWPLGVLPWVNPSPNATTLSMARCYPGTVMLEGTHLSEGRGTTRPLELIGAPDIDAVEVLKKMESLAPEWLIGCKLRPCFFQPTFHKYEGKICSGFQIHVDDESYQHAFFKPYRLMALAFKAIRTLHPEYAIWRDFHYEYEKGRLAIDIINGGTSLREWVDEKSSTPGDLEKLLEKDEATWRADRSEFLISEY